MTCWQKQESDQKSLLQNKNKTRLLSMRLQLIKAELETTEAGLTTQQAELEHKLLGCRIGYSSRWKNITCFAKSTAEAVAASTAASVAQSQAIAESEAAAQAVASSEAAAFVGQSGRQQLQKVAQPSEATVSETATASEVAKNLFHQKLQKQLKSQLLQLQKQHKSLKHSQNQLPQRHNESLLPSNIWSTTRISCSCSFRSFQLLLAKHLQQLQKHQQVKHLQLQKHQLQ